MWEGGFFHSDPHRVWKHWIIVEDEMWIPGVSERSWKIGGIGDIYNHPIYNI